MLLLLLLIFTIQIVNGSVQFDVKSKSEKCLSDDISKSSLAVVHYNVISKISSGLTKVSMLSKDPNGKYIKEDHDIDSKEIHTFTFTAEVDGSYDVCFFNNNDNVVRVSLDFKHGVEAKDYSEVAKKEHLAPVEKELRMMEDTVDEIHREMLYMREREAAMRNTNESTNARVLWFSFFSIVILCAMGTWQVFYLKKFFKSKKLI